MHKLGPVSVGGTNPVRIMGIINVSPESFYKKSIKTSTHSIANTVNSMEQAGADIIDVGAMSTAPYLSTLISENQEIERIKSTINIIQRISDIPISIDTCRAKVAKVALDMGVQIINDISGLKYDNNMKNQISKYCPSLVLCAFNSRPVVGNHINATKKLLKKSVDIAIKSGISKNKIVVDPAIGFFRSKGVGRFFTKINSDWLKRDLDIIQNLNQIKLGFPILVSVSNKSFLGRLLDKKPQDRLAGTLACEVLSVIKGANIVRTHNVAETKQVLDTVQKISRTNKSL